MKERLQKYLAECGIASRRKCEELIVQGHISVNGNIVTEMGLKIDPSVDTVAYNGKFVICNEKKVYIMLNKPEGYVSTAKEQFNRPKVTDLVKTPGIRLYPVGRLDYDSSGLLLLTNDGDVTYSITHPGHEVDKTYVVEVNGVPDDEDIKNLRDGIDIGGFITSPAKVSIISTSKNNALLSITIHEGKNREIRRMCSAAGHDVLKLKRVSIGSLSLGNLKKGEWRYLEPSEVNYLQSIGKDTQFRSK